MPKQLEQPTHGWQRGWHSFASGARLFIKGFFTGNIWRKENPVNLRGSRVAVLSDVDIHSTDPDTIQHLNHQGMYWWDDHQIEALSGHQIRALSEPQLEALICNPNISGDQIQDVVKALAGEAHVSKIGILCRSLRNDPMEMTKIGVIADVILHDMNREEAKRAIVVLCRNCSDRQFRTVLKFIPFEYIKQISEYELDNPDLMALTRLDLRVEEAQTQNSSELVDLAKGMEVLDHAFADLVAGKPLSIDHKATPWNRVDPHVVMQLISLVDNGIDDDRSVEIANRLLAEILTEITQRQSHLHMLNHRFTTLTDNWADHFLDVYQGHADMIAGVVTPQYSVLEHMSKMLMRKSGEKLTEEERVALLETFDKGCMLADVIHPHVMRARRYLGQLKRERQFLDDNIDAFFDNIRHETRVGRFTIEVFWRLIHLGNSSEAFPLLHGDMMEELVVLHPSFDRASRLLQAFHNYEADLERLANHFEQYLEQLPIDELSERLHTQRKILHKVA